MKEIQLTQGNVALVDDDDFEWLSQWRWGTMKKQYAVRWPKPGKPLFMHREILERHIGQYPEITDHKDGNGFNNTKDNLRPATHRQNMSNRRLHKNNTSGFMGVCKRKGLAGPRHWIARIYANNHQYYLGCFSTPDEAARVYDAAAIKYHGEFATLNFPRAGERSSKSTIRLNTGGLINKNAFTRRDGD